MIAGSQIQMISMIRKREKATILSLVLTQKCQRLICIMAMSSRIKIDGETMDMEATVVMVANQLLERMESHYPQLREEMLINMLVAMATGATKEVTSKIREESGIGLIDGDMDIMAKEITLTEAIITGTGASKRVNGRTSIATNQKIKTLTQTELQKMVIVIHLIQLRQSQSLNLLQLFHQ